MPVLLCTRRVPTQNCVCLAGARPLCKLNPAQHHAGQPICQQGGRSAAGVLMLEC